MVQLQSCLGVWRFYRIFTVTKMVSFNRDAQDSEKKLTTLWTDSFLGFPLLVRAHSCKEDQQFLRSSLSSYIHDTSAVFYFLFVAPRH